MFVLKQIYKVRLYSPKRYTSTAIYKFMKCKKLHFMEPFKMFTRNFLIFFCNQITKKAKIILQGDFGMLFIS